MPGNVSTEELRSALNLSDDLKQRLNDYERQNWAANLSSPEVKLYWSKFLAKLETALRTEQLDDHDLIMLIHYLSTIDTAALLEKIRTLNEARQARFLDLLNWVAQNSPDDAQRANASSVKERILMAYRLEQFPNIYSPARIARAVNVITSS